MLINATNTTTTTTMCTVDTTLMQQSTHHTPLPPTTQLKQTSNEQNERGKQRKNLHDFLLETVDMILSCVIVAPCVIAYWRGTWELMGVLIFPGNLPISAFCSFVIGGFGHVLFTFTQYFFTKHIHPDKRRLTFYVVSRLYTASFGLVCVNMWRGSWMLCDWLTSASSLPIISCVTILALIFLIATRTVCNLSSVPFCVAVDHKSDYFEINTMFRIEGFRQPGLYILDTLFSIFVVGSLIVLVWRGTWGIIDLTLYPKNFEKSAWSSFTIGYTIVLISFVLQPILRCICNRLNDGICKLFICDIFYIVTFLGAVNSWRGIWNIVDIYIYPNDKISSYWVTMVVPFLILAALKCSNSVLVRGIYIDAEAPGGESLDIQINYCKLHFERERSKKQQLYQRRLLQHHLARNLEQEVQSALIEKPLKEFIIKSHGGDLV